MRKQYVKPTLVVETFAMEEDIALNCQTIVKKDPDACYGGFGRSLFSQDTTEAPYYPDSCTCYHTAPGSGWFTS